MACQLFFNIACRLCRYLVFMFFLILVNRPVLQAYYILKIFLMQTDRNGPFGSPGISKL